MDDIALVPRRLEPAVPGDGMALCLSGGGYRAMLFHVGVLLRLNELGLLVRLTRVSSVSGGSITAGVLGSRWRQLEFVGGVATGLDELLVTPIRALARRTIDVCAVLLGCLPGLSASGRIAAAYRRHLFGDATLQELPVDSQGPRFVFNATNAATGTLFRFSRPYAGDYRVGRIESPKFALADVVAASSAFPPFLSPTVLPLADATWLADADPRLLVDLRERAVLTDGGVYDNLGLEAALKRCRTLLVSDAGQRIAVDAVPKIGWLGHTRRVLDVIDSQVRSLRKRWLVDTYLAGRRDGVYIGIRSDPGDYPRPSPLAVAAERAEEVAAVATRLACLDDAMQERVINWGYAICDTGARSHMFADGEAVPEARFPYPRGV